MLLTLGVGQMWASTTATMYFSIPASTVGCYTVKAYYNFGYSQSGTVNMTKVGYNGTDVVYSVELTADHDNVDALKFQWWDGETWKGEKQVLSGWVALDKDGRMYSYSSSSWGSYSIDAATSYKIYFVNNDSWGSCYAYAYYADCQNNWSWHGQSMSSESKQYGTKNIYSITLTSRFPNVIFNDNSSSEKASTACYDNRGKMYDNGTWRTLQYKVTLNMQSGTGGSGSVTAGRCRVLLCRRGMDIRSQDIIRAQAEVVRSTIMQMEQVQTIGLPMEQVRRRCMHIGHKIQVSLR